MASLTPKLFSETTQLLFPGCSALNDITSGPGELHVVLSGEEPWGLGYKAFIKSVRGSLVDVEVGI